MRPHPRYEPLSRRRVLRTFTTGGFLSVAGCLGRESPASRSWDSTLSGERSWKPPPETARWQWQLQGEIDPSVDVTLYDIDGFDVPRETVRKLKDDGRYVVAYFSGGSWEDWRPDANAFPEAVKRKPLANWSGERWLDISRPEILEPIMATRAALAAAKGFDAIEWDNVDVYDNDAEATGVRATHADQLIYNRLLARIAHDHGLAVILKNDPSQVRDLEPAFDGCLAEEAYQYGQVDDYMPFREAGKWVGVCEYSGTLDCADAQKRRIMLIKKPLDLGAPILATCE